MMAEAQERKTRETMNILHEISKLLNTNLDAETLTTCVRLLETGVNPEALVSVVQELRREALSLQEDEEGGSTS